MNKVIFEKLRFLVVRKLAPNQEPFEIQAGKQSIRIEPQTVFVSASALPTMADGDDHITIVPEKEKTEFLVGSLFDDETGYFKLAGVVDKDGLSDCLERLKGAVVEAHHFEESGIKA